MNLDAQSHRGAARLKDLLSPTGEESLLAVDYPRPRFRVPVWQAAFLALVLVAISVLALRRSPTDIEPTAAYPAQTVAPTALVPTALAPTALVPTALAPGGGPLVVSVVGEVEVSGLVTLSNGARVAEALEHARPLPGANLTDINHAARLTDGQQINVRPVGEPVAVGEPVGVGEEPGGKLNLNTATPTQLTALSGVGEVTAQAIVGYREKIGQFTSVEQLQDIAGIGPAKLAQISPQVTL